MKKKLELASSIIEWGENRGGYTYDTQYEFDVIYEDEDGMRHPSYDVLIVRTSISAQREGRYNVRVLYADVELSLSHLGSLSWIKKVDVDEVVAPCSTTDTFRYVADDGYDVYTRTAIEAFIENKI